MLEMSNTLQREPQQVDLNVRHELISCPPRLVFFFCMGTCGFISRQSALIAWHNDFKMTLEFDLWWCHGNCNMWPLHSTLECIEWLASVYYV